MCSRGAETLDQLLAGSGGHDEEVLALVDLRDRVEAALVERVGAFDASEGWAADGAYSFACWLRARSDVSRAESLQLGRFARTLRSMPATEAAVADGKLSVVKARLLAGVINDRTRERFDEQETFLVEQIQGLDVDGTAVALRYWKRLADRDGPDPGDLTRNRASMTIGLDDRWHLDADLDPVSGALVNAVLQAIVDRMHQEGRFNDLGDRATASRRKADALVEMARRSTGADPEQAGVHPDVVVVVPLGRLLEDDPDPLAPPPELVGTGPIDLDDVYRLALLGTVSTLVTDANGRPLNLGRKQRLATGDQWIALRLRDGGCVIPGCDRPAEWCQAHHLAWWDRDGGPTDLANLCLVCTAHHHLIHDHHWALVPQADGTWHLNRPDGTTVDQPRYPGHRRHRQEPDHPAEPADPSG